MRKELVEKLKKDFPLTYGAVCDERQAYSMFGIEVGDGWYKILERAGKKMEPLIQAWVDKNPEAEYRPCVSQIKEKYGTMRFYMTCGTDEMFQVASDAEAESEGVCEKCGKPGEIRSTSNSWNGWLFTACDEHSEGKVPLKEEPEEDV